MPCYTMKHDDIQATRIKSSSESDVSSDSRHEVKNGILEQSNKVNFLGESMSEAMYEDCQKTLRAFYDLMAQWNQGDTHES